LMDVSERERVITIMQPLTDGHMPSVEFAAQCISANGETIWCEWHCTAIRDEENAALSIMAFAKDISETVKAEQQLARQARLDRLTGLPNRSALETHLSAAIARAREVNARVAVLFVDLDRFKIVNDTLGHGFGDLLLIAFADRVRAVIKGRDIIARHGGDEFIVVLESFSAENAPELAAERIFNALRRPFEIEGRAVHIGASIGYSTFPEHGQTPESLFRRADVAMYRAKALGRNRLFRYETSLELAQNEMVAIERALRRAITNQSLEVWFQPCVSIATGQILGVEALSRWSDPELGRVPPAKFFAVAEEIGLIHKLGDYVLTKACEVASRYPSLTFGINVSVMQLQDANFVNAVQRAIFDSGCKPNQIEIEVTETRDFLSPDLFETVTRLAQELGVRVAIDDFGTGYSNLANLRRLPVRTIKIDQSFTSGVVEDSQDRAIVASTTMLAHGLSMRVVAEGVETAAQLAVLRALNCDAYQGFLVSPAVPEEKLAQLLIERDRSVAA
jgi:diguanylate cyclase (GGDEF)-like protein